MRYIRCPERLFTSPLHQSNRVNNLSTLIASNRIKILIHSNLCQIGRIDIICGIVLEWRNAVIDHNLMCERNACIEQCNEENPHNSVFDDPFFLVFCKEQNSCSEDKNHDQFKSNKSQLRRSCFTKCLQSCLIVPRTNVHCEENSGNEHTSHPNHRWELAAKVSSDVAHTTSRHEPHLSASTFIRTIVASLHL